jgi:hypothetical protein
MIQWATGAKGVVALREIIRHPNLELVGLRVYDPSKVGRDAGEIAGLPAVGIAATDRIEDIIALDADCVFYMAQVRLPMDEHDDNVCRLLESGKNVIALTGYYWPATHGAAYVERLERACARGRSTLFGTGFSPGFITERLAVSLTEACTRVDSIHYLEVCDCSRNKESLIVEVMGCGKPPADLPLDDHTTRLTTWYHYEAIDALAHALGVTLDEKRAEIETRTATQDEQLACGLTIRAGTVGATIRRWIGLVNGRPFITSEHRWMVVSHLPDFAADDLWQITIEGAPAIQMQLRLADSFADAPADDPASNPVFQAIVAPLLNGVATVCAAPPGILRAPVFAPWRADA